ncbi:MAG: Rrf2 family transcriptional regulator [Candidatus Omnitrophica bacterium]|nr:Rrf2 family transcriptional regulator [Candidatus Omnitrophota bacterium]
MKITYKGDYALKTILDLAAHFGNGPVAINDLSRRLDIPTKFLEQILLDLKRAHFVESRRGKIGGYCLSRPPAQITLGEVTRFINGPVEPIACVDKKYSGCHDIGKCVFRDVWAEVNRSTARIIDNVTFEDLLKKSKKINKAFTYQI